MAATQPTTAPSADGGRAEGGGTCQTRLVLSAEIMIGHPGRLLSRLGRRRGGRRARGRAPAPVQQPLDFDRGKHGGRRPGAGRPRKTARGAAHSRRPEVDSQSPVHVSIRLQKGLRRTLRSRRIYAMIKKALRAARERLGCRVVHYSIQGNHIHLLVEAEDAWCLARAMKGFQVRVARGLNGIAGRRGSVFRDRYSATVIRDPLHARAALLYVLQNAKRHAMEVLDLGPRVLARDWVDPFSSAPYFPGWKPACRRWVPEPDTDDPLVAPPESDLLRHAWKVRPLDTGEVPRAARL
jgi:REP element-mobilizing transposase RayT